VDCDGALITARRDPLTEVGGPRRWHFQPVCPPVPGNAARWWTDPV
jgi:hypothetical protein